MGRGSSGRDNAPLTRQEQFEIIQRENPAQDDIHTWIRSPDDIVSFREAMSDFMDDGVTPDFTARDIENALRTGRITVYSSYPIANGYFVTPSRMEAQSYAGGGRVYSETVNISDVAWIDEIQGQLARRRR